MLCVKKLYREELLQLALLLSLLRVDPESYLGLDIRTLNVGSLDLTNGSGWHTDHTIIHRPMFLHPKNPDSMLLNYQRDLFEELNSLGRYNRMNSGLNAIHAYLLNIDESNTDADSAGPSVSVSTSTDTPTVAQNSSLPEVSTAELTQEVQFLIDIVSVKIYVQMMKMAHKEQYK